MAACSWLTFAAFVSAHYDDLFINHTDAENHEINKRECAVPENIHFPSTEGIGISWGLCKAKKFKEMYEA